jgi:hypothetical protein
VQHTRCCDKRWCRDRMVIASGVDLHLHDQYVAREFICWRERAQACVTCTVVPMVGSVLVDPGPTTESDSEMRCPASRAAAGTRQQTSTIVTSPIIFAVHPSRLCCSHRQRLQTAPRSAFSSSNARQASNVHVCTRLPGTLHPWGESGLAPWTSESIRVGRAKSANSWTKQFDFSSSSSDSVCNFGRQF